MPRSARNSWKVWKINGLLVAFLTATAAAQASSGPAPSLPEKTFEAGETVRIAAVVDGVTLTLDDGRTVRLAGIETPVFNGPHAAIYLKQTLAGQTVRLHYGDVRQDRWRRVVAHLVRDDNSVWVQGDLLARGLARAFPTPDNPGGAASMYGLEDAARTEKRGLWAEDRFAVRTPPLTKADIGALQVVEGRVVDAAKVRGQVYLNFGADYQTDFTILVPSAVRRQMERAGTDFSTLKDQQVRVRGWLKEWNGPMIEVTHAEQLEILPLR